MNLADRAQALVPFMRNELDSERSRHGCQLEHSAWPDEHDFGLPIAIASVTGVTPEIVHRDIVLAPGQGHFRSTGQRREIIKSVARQRLLEPADAELVIGVGGSRRPV